MYFTHQIGTSSYYLKFAGGMLSFSFAFMVTALWPIAYLYSKNYAIVEGYQANRYLCFINLSMIITILLAFSGNLFTMFVLYEMLTFVTMFLVGYNYTAHAESSVQSYIVHLFGASLLLLLPAMLILHSNGIGDFASTNNSMSFSKLSSLSNSTYTILFLMCLFGLAKSAIFPLHGWLPEAMVAGYPVSALLHSVIVVKAGIFCIAKLSLELFSYDLLNTKLLYQEQLKYLICFGIVYSGLMAIKQNTLKATLAYSTINQLNMILLTILSFTKDSFYAAALYTLLHSFTKISLFFVCGCIYIRTHATKLEQLQGLSDSHKYLFWMFVISAFSLCGLSIIPSNVIKKLLLSSIFSSHNLILSCSIIISIICTAIYMGKIIMVMMRPADNRQSHIQLTQIPQINHMIIASSLTIILALGGYYFVMSHI